MQIYTTERISARRSFTPEGYLFCEEVPISRIGVLNYGPNELNPDEGEAPLQPGDDGLIRVTRTAEAWFNPITIASFQGKPITVGHPTGGLIDPDTWKEATVGLVQNVRRGEGVNSDVLLADLLITNPIVINQVQNHEINEVSCGYDAKYKQTTAGTAIQFDVIGNHVALVDEGRCGIRCSIGDSVMFSLFKKKSAIRRAYYTRDDAGFEKLVDENDQGSGGGDAGAEAEGKEGKSFPPKEPEGGKEDEGGGKGGGTHHHITVNVNGKGGMESTGALEKDGAAAGPDGSVDPNAAGSEAEPDVSKDPVGAIMAMFKKFDARLTAIEQAISGGGTSNAGAQQPPAANTENDASNVDDHSMDHGEGTRDGEGGEGSIAPLSKDPAPGATGDEEGGEGSIAPLSKDPAPGATGDALYRPSMVLTGVEARLQFQDTISRAELLLPGIRFPTFDTKLAPAKNVANLIAFKRRALKGAYATQDGMQSIRPYVSGVVGDAMPNFEKMPVDTVNAVFIAASDRMVERNRLSSQARFIAGKKAATNDSTTGGGRITDPAELNAFYDAYYHKAGPYKRH